MRVARVVQDQAVGFSWREAQAAANNLLIQADGFGRAQNSYQIHMRCIKAGCQYRYVYQKAKLLIFEGFD